MKKIKEILILLFSIFVGIPILCHIVLLINPGNRIAEVVLGVLSIIWLVFNQFELQDLLQSIGLFLLIAGFLCGIGIHITGKIEARIWAVVPVICGIIAFITGKLI